MRLQYNRAVRKAKPTDSCVFTSLCVSISPSAAGQSLFRNLLPFLSQSLPTNVTLSSIQIHLFVISKHFIQSAIFQHFMGGDIVAKNLKILKLICTWRNPYCFLQGFYLQLGNQCERWHMERDYTNFDAMAAASSTSAGGHGCHPHRNTSWCWLPAAGADGINFDFQRTGGRNGILAIHCLCMNYDSSDTNHPH